jgi:hypothetical protein
MVDSDVFDEILGLLPPTPVVTRGKMFGMPCLKVNGKVFACFWAGGLSVKLPGEEVAKALQISGIAILDPMGNNRPMKEWILIDEKVQKLWVEYSVKSYGYVVGLGDTSCGKKPKAAKKPKSS